MSTINQSDSLPPVEKIDPAAAFLALSESHGEGVIQSALLQAATSVRTTMRSWSNPHERLEGLGLLDRAVIEMTSGTPPLQKWFTRECLTPGHHGRALGADLQHHRFAELSTAVLQKLTDILASLEK